MSAQFVKDRLEMIRTAVFEDLDGILMAVRDAMSAVQYGDESTKRRVMRDLLEDVHSLIENCRENLVETEQVIVHGMEQRR
jgi:hypothetical protein